MAGSNSRIVVKLNTAYSAYLERQEEAPLLAEVGKLAKRIYRDDDFAQEFTIKTWQSLSDLGNLPCTFSGWIWRRLQWRRIDHIRSNQSLLDHEVPVSVVDENGEPASAEDILDLLLARATQDLFTERVLKLADISDTFVRQIAQYLLAGYTQEEVAVRLGVNPSTLRSRLSRYRKRIDQRTD